VARLPRGLVLISVATGARVYIIGTAHVSKLSAEEVRATIRKVKPSQVRSPLNTTATILTCREQVLLELCQHRKNMIESVAVCPSRRLRTPR